MPKYVILGAGVAGLAAAVTLVRKGERDVLVLERERRPGGQCRSVAWQGCTVDLGPHRLLITVPRVEPFIRGLLGDSLRTVERKSQMVLLGRRTEYPPRPGEILRVLGWRRTASVLAGYLAKPVLTRRRGLAPDSYAGYIARRFGTGLYDLIFRDYAFKVWQEDPDELDEAVARIRLTSRGLLDSVRELFRKQSAHAAREFLYPEGGIGALPERMAAEVVAAGGKIEYGVELASVGHARGGNPAVEYRAADRGRTVGYGCLISTIPLPALVSLMKPSAPREIRSAADGLHFSAMRFVCLLVSRPLVSENLWMYFPDPDLRISRLYEVTNFSPELVPKGKTCLVVEVPGRVGDPSWRLPEKHLTHKVIAELEQVGLVGREEIEASKVINLTEAYPIYRRGYRKRIDACCDYVSSVAGLITTGRQGLFCYNNADHSIDMGMKAGEVAAAGPGDTRRFYAFREEFEKYRIVD